MTAQVRSAHGDAPLAAGSAATAPATPRRGSPALRLLRIALLVLACAALLLVAAYLALRHAYPPARLAALLARQVTDATGRSFRIDGELSIHLLPDISVQADDVVLGNADWGTRPEMARVRHASFEIGLRDLLAGRIRILGIEVQGARVWLESDGAGRFNWQFDTRKDPGRTGARLIAPERLSISASALDYRDPHIAIPLGLTITSFELRAEAAGNRIESAFRFADRPWTLEGSTGRLVDLLASAGAWPLDLRLATDGAALGLDGTLGTGPSAGTFDADVHAQLSSAQALTSLWPEAARLPMPADLVATVSRRSGDWQADPVQLGLGGQALRGRVLLRPAASPPRVEAELSADAIDLGPWQLGATPPAASRPARAPTRQLFGDTPLPLATLPGLSLDLVLEVQRLNGPPLPVLTGLRLHLASEPDRWTVDPLSFTLDGAQVRGRVNLAERPGAPPRTAVRLRVDAPSVQALDEQLEKTARTRGGQGSLDLDLAMTGRTPRSLAASATGDVRLSLRDVRLAGRSSALDKDLLARLLAALVPGHGSADNLLIQCVVAELPLRSGLAAIDRSLALETSQIAVSASGRLDLARQTVELEFRPRVKKGLDINPGSLVQLMLLSGPLEAPTLSIDPRGTVRQAASLGIAAATGGLSLLAPAVRGTSGAAAGCQLAARPSATGTRAQANSHEEKARRPLRALFR